MNAPPMQEIFARCGTDKGTHHGYGPVYDSLFPTVESREAVLTVLEIGILKGNSVRAWLEIFPRALIAGLDPSLCDTCPKSHRVKLFQGDQRDRDKLREIITAAHGHFDLIVDDASHRLPDQLFTLFVLWPSLVPGGVYVIEELDLLTPGYYGEGPSEWRENIGLLTGATMINTKGKYGEFPLVVIRK